MDYPFSGVVTTHRGKKTTQVTIGLYREHDQHLALYRLPQNITLTHPSHRRIEERTSTPADHVKPEAIPFKETPTGSGLIRIDATCVVETHVPTILIIHAQDTEEQNAWELPYLLLDGHVINLHMPFDIINLRGETWLDLPPLTPDK